MITKEILTIQWYSIAFSIALNIFIRYNNVNKKKYNNVNKKK